MANFLRQLKNRAISVVLFLVLFAVMFLVTFYLVNLDVKSVKEKTAAVVQGAETVDPSVEIKKRLGQTTFSVEGYDEWALRFSLDKSNSGLDQDPDKEGLPNYLEYVHGTNPLKADTDGDKFSDRQEINNGYDPDAAGDAKPAVDIKIAKINVDAPMVWSLKDDEKSMLKDLERGLNHFPKSAAPGQKGNAIISGHSSNYVWAKGDYNSIFKELSNLQKGDMVATKVTQKNGRVITYKYEVQENFITEPDDERIFADSDDSILTLSTCWPVGTALKRTIIKAKLLQ